MPVKAEPTTVVYTGQVYRDVARDVLYRVVETGHGQADTFLVRVDGSRLDIRIMPTEEFRWLADPGCPDENRFERVASEDDPYAASRLTSRFSDTARFKTESDYKLIETLVTRKTPEQRAAFRQLLRNCHVRAAMLVAQAAAERVVRHTIYKHVRHYLQRGMRPDSVACAWPNCGRLDGATLYRSDTPAERSHRTYTTRPGRPGHDPDVRYALPSEALDRLLYRAALIYATCRQVPWKIEVPDELLKKIRAEGREVPRGHRQAVRRRPRGAGSIRGKAAKSGRRTQGQRRRSRPTQQDLVDYTNYLLRCKREVRDADGHLIELELARDGKVTVRQFQHHWLTDHAPAVRKRHLMGARAYELGGKPYRGHALQHCQGPGDAFLMDATIADTYLVSVLDRTQVVRRPTVYLVVDLWSRMVVGLHVTFDPPSFLGAALAFESIVTPKAELCARWGFTISWADWPCDTMGSVLYADRGSEYLVEAKWRAMTSALTFGMDTSPPYLPVRRAVVERSFATIPVIYQRATFGVVEKDASTRGAPRYAWDAINTRPEFIRMLLRAIHVYHRRAIRGEGYVDRMALSGRPNTPLGRWEWGIEHNSGSLHELSVDEVRLATWPEARATISNGGLEWRGRRYTSDTIETELVHLYGARAHEKIPIQYDPDDPTHILLDGRGYPEFATLARTNPFNVPAGCTLYELNMARHCNLRNATDERDRQEASRIMQAENNRLDSLAARAEQRAELDAKGMAHPDVRAMKRAAAREAETEHRFRHFRVIRGGKAAAPVTPPPAAPDVRASRHPLTDLARIKKDRAMNILSPKS